MHIEPHVVQGAKLVISYVTAAGVLAWSAKHSFDEIKNSSLSLFLTRTLLATMIVFCCFEVLPHYPVGVSEVHLILGTTLLLFLGVASASIGLALGLLFQGVLFAPFDLPQYGMNVTTLLASLAVLSVMMKQMLPSGVRYVELSYRDVLKMSMIWEGSIVAWVSFWVLLGQGFSWETLQSLATFGSAYMSVIVIEPLIDLGLLAWAKQYGQCGNILHSRLYRVS